MSIFALPEELLVPILANAAVDNPATLANVALVCRAFHLMVYDNAEVWRAIHNLKYDNPVYACAFHSPRTDYDWKQRVLDRALVERLVVNSIIQESWEPSTPEGDALLQNKHRVLQTILELYHDLPEKGHPSRNSAVISAVAKSPNFPNLCHKTASDVRVASHLHFIFLHYGGLYGRQWTLPRFVWYHQGRFNKEASMYSREVVYWHGAASDAQLFLQMLTSKWDRGPHIDPGLIERRVEGQLEAVRGHGILGLHRPQHCTDDVWDWAGVGGQWHCLFTDQSLLEVLIGHTALGPSSYTTRYPHFEDFRLFDLTPVNSPANIVKACQTQFGKEDPRVVEYLQLVQVAPGPLPPIYFYATTTTGFVLGVVHLTKDCPPELRWDILVIGLENHAEDRVFQGVQGGGPGARRGVFGSYRLWDYQFPQHLYIKLGGTPEDRVDFRAWSNGGGWIFKD